MWQKARIVDDTVFHLNGKYIYVRAVPPFTIYGHDDMYETNLRPSYSLQHIAVSRGVVELTPIFEEEVGDIVVGDYAIRPEDLPGD